MSAAQDEQTFLDHALDAEWHLITKRADIPLLPVWLKFDLTSPSAEWRAIYGVDIPWACFWHGKELEIYVRSEEYKQAVMRATKVMRSPETACAHADLMVARSDELRAVARVFESVRLPEVSAEELWTEYERIIALYADAFRYGFVVWCTQLLHREAEHALGARRTPISDLGLTPQAALEILITPDEKTPYQEKERELDVLRALHQGTSKRQSQSLKKEIMRFLRKYRWVGYEYEGPALTQNDVMKEIERPHAPRTRVVAKERIVATLALSEEEMHVLNVLALVSYLKDYRNAADDYAHFCLDHFYAGIAKRHGVSKRVIKFLRHEELKEIVLRGASVDAAMLAERQRYCAAVTLPKLSHLKHYYAGDDAHRAHDKMRAASGRINTFSDHAALKGVVASAGKATGPARIVRAYEDTEKVRHGDIIVAYMTSPKFISAIRRCAAIVTDEGGITSHAAIIAREMGKPCIIGTKIATRVLHDGDLVEVDADSGIVRVLECATAGIEK